MTRPQLLAFLVATIGMCVFDLSLCQESDELQQS